MPVTKWRGMPIIVVMLAAPVCAEDLKALLERGLAAAEKGDCAAALADLQRAVGIQPRMVPAHNAIGVCEARLGHPERATRSFLEIVKLEPEAWQGWNNLGINYLAVNQPAQAAPAFRKAAARNAGVPAVWFNLGWSLLKLGRAQEAFGAFDRAQKLAPGNTGIGQAWLDAASRLATQAGQLIDRGQFAAAYELLAAVRRPLEKSPSWNNLIGYAEFKLGRTGPALTHLQTALNLEPNNEDYLLDMGEFLAYHHAYDKAAEFFAVAAERMPRSPRVRYSLAVTDILRNRRPEATAALQQLLAEYPRFEAVYRALGECYEDAGNWAGMVDLGRKLESLNPSNAVGWYLEGAGLERRSLIEQVRPDAALPPLQHAVRLDPGSSRYHFRLGKAYEEAGRLGPAAAELERTLRLDPQHERAHYVLGRIYQRLGKPELARHELRMHSEIKSRDRDAAVAELLAAEHQQSAAPAAGPPP